MKWALGAVLIASALANGCSGTSQETTGEQSMNTLKHPNGLAVQFNAAAMKTTETQRGFEFVPADVDERRTPWSAELTLEPGPQPSGSWPDSRDLNGHTARFRVDTRPGGSGGAIFVLNAWLGCTAHHIALRVELQAETQPDAEFDPGWALLSSATCPS